jgi:hypothetical protein
MAAAAIMHFVVRNLEYSPILVGYTVTCYSNHYVHLWLRWTDVEPQKHIKPRIVRGAQVGTYIDQCFVSFHDIEQNEPGDTFTHTFTVTDWPYCETRWFYFWGEIGGNKSPSASCLFEKHSTSLTRYCFNNPRNIGYKTSTGCNHLSYPFKPQSSYTIKHWKTHLRRNGADNPQNTFELCLWTADASGLPLALIGQGSKTGIVLPPWPNWLDIDFAVTDTPVTAGQMYAASYRLSENYQFITGKCLQQDQGFGGVCPHGLPPATGFYYCKPGYDPSGYCKPPPGVLGWYVHVGGGVQYFETFGGVTLL